MNLSCKPLTNFFSFCFPSAKYQESCNGFLKEYATRQFNMFLWVSLITITLLALQKHVKLFRLWAKASKIPGPPSTSFFGHNTFHSRPNFIDVFSELHYQHGSVFKLWMGPAQLLVSLKDPGLVKEMLSKAEDKLPFCGKAHRLAFGRSSLFFCPYDQAHKRRESLASKLNEKLLGRENLISTHATQCIMERIEKIVDKGSIDTKLLSQHIAFTILGTTLFGDAFLAWSKATFYEELLMKIAKDASFWASYRVTPFWKQGFWRYKSLSTKLKCLTQDIVQQCRKNYKLLCHTDKNAHNEIPKTGTKDTFSEAPSSGVEMQDKLFSQLLDGILNASEEQYANVTGTMFHGCVATAGLIGEVLERLITAPEIQDKIHLEIMKVKQESIKDHQNVERMLLLLATIYESARFLPARPLLQRCSLKDDLSLKNGTIIPAGAVIVVPTQLLQMDNASWGDDASAFNPYRFLSKAGKHSGTVDASSTDVADPFNNSFILKDPNENPTFLAFGSGKRACVAQKFVIHGVATWLASLLENYEVRLHAGSSNDPTSKTNPAVVFARRQLRE